MEHVGSNWSVKDRESSAVATDSQGCIMSWASPSIRASKLKLKITNRNLTQNFSGIGMIDQETSGQSATLISRGIYFKIARATVHMQVSYIHEGSSHGKRCPEENSTRTSSVLPPRGSSWQFVRCPPRDPGEMFNCSISTVNVLRSQFTCFN